MLFSFSVNDRLYERFLLLSYAIRLLMISSKYADDAGKLINIYLQKLDEDYGEVVFSPNVHSLTHLAWQVRQFGPLWATSAMMFESANYLLQSKFTGTVNHLPLLVERYRRNKDSLRVEVMGDCLQDWCLNLRQSKLKLKRRPVVSNVPEDLRKEGDVFYGWGQFAGVFYDSKAHSCHKNSYISFATKKKTRYGQIKIFYTNSVVEKLAVEQYRVLETVKCNSDGLPSEIQSYVCVEKTDKLFLISDCDIREMHFFSNRCKEVTCSTITVF